MNRDIGQLIAVLAQLQADIGSQRVGLAALGKEIDRLGHQIQLVDPDRLAGTVASAATKAAAAGVAQVALAADSAKAASETASAIAQLTAKEHIRKLRWRRAVFLSVLLGCFLTGAVAGRFVGLTQPPGCVLAGGKWISKPEATACLFN